VRSTHRSLEGLGYLGMLSATPTGMRLALLQATHELERKSGTPHAPVWPKGFEGRFLSTKKKRTTLLERGPLEGQAFSWRTPSANNQSARLSPMFWSIP
jgi:hypothetical protein